MTIASYSICKAVATAAIDTECADFQAALDETATRFIEPFVTAPSPGITTYLRLSRPPEKYSPYQYIPPCPKTTWQP